MNEQFQERRNLFLLLFGLILVLLIVLFFAFLKPMMAEKKSKETEVVHLDRKIADLKVKNTRADKQKRDDTALRYQNKMPRNPELDALMRSLEEISAVSMSRIEQIEFSYDAALPEPEDKADTDDKITDATVDKDVSKPDTDSVEASKIAEAFLKETPKNLHAISIRMEVASPDYAHFDKMIKAIEKLERITLVNTLEFKKPAEAALVLDEFPDETVTCTVELMTFYYDEPVKNHK